MKTKLLSQKYLYSIILYYGKLEIFDEKHIIIFSIIVISNYSSEGTIISNMHNEY